MLFCRAVSGDIGFIFSFFLGEVRGEEGIALGEIGEVFGEVPGGNCAEIGCMGILRGDGVGGVLE